MEARTAGIFALGAATGVALTALFLRNRSNQFKTEKRN